MNRRLTGSLVWCRCGLTETEMAPMAPVQYVTELLGVNIDLEGAISWPITLMVLFCVPIASL
jgi:hypothetical protein